jgi:hypothetical protein
MRIQSAMLSVLVTLFVAGCYGDGREAGDDPTRSDEGPTAGRPETDASQVVEPKDMGGGARKPEEVDDGRGTLDGSSDELQSAEPAR